MSSAVMSRVSSEMQNTKHLAKSLKGVAIPRSFFNPKDPHDLAVYDVFRQSGKWVKHFYVEEPYNDVPTMVQQKLMNEILSSVKDLSTDLAESHRVKLDAS